MKAKEILERKIRDSSQKEFHVVAFTDNGKWFHVHKDEEFPVDARIGFIETEHNEKEESE